MNSLIHADSLRKGPGQLVRHPGPVVTSKPSSFPAVAVTLVKELYWDGKGRKAGDMEC